MASIAHLPSKRELLPFSGKENYLVMFPYSRSLPFFPVVKRHPVWPSVGLFTTGCLVALFTKHPESAGEDETGVSLDIEGCHSSGAGVQRTHTYTRTHAPTCTHMCTYTYTHTHIQNPPSENLKTLLSLLSILLPVLYPLPKEKKRKISPLSKEELTSLSREW